MVQSTDDTQRSTVSYKPRKCTLIGAVSSFRVTTPVPPFCSLLATAITPVAPRLWPTRQTFTMSCGRLHFFIRDTMLESTHSYTSEMMPGRFKPLVFGPCQ